ncbi:hypothetical protein [Marinitoga sp. 38H-ov]|uniref:hypothetical protein n=1 Tax=Marinitoga sp. 38H-ov TaxID=1755814 RepID=UPI0016A097FD|nr:hypothetical protein [Marinitoga sp. 38H-ov]KAF2956265.1 hypothetical protein AS160_00270 [Marinitoga sp. 38H-ov]
MDYPKTQSALSKMFNTKYNKRINEKDRVIKLEKKLDEVNKDINDELNPFLEDFVKVFENFGFPGFNTEKVNLLSDITPESLLI